LFPEQCVKKLEGQDTPDKTTPLISITINGIKQQALIDSGSTISIIKYAAARKICIGQGVSISKYQGEVRTIHPEPVKIEGKMKLTVTINGKNMEHEALVCDTKLFAGTILLGSDFLHKVNANINYEDKCIYIRGDRFPFNTNSTC
jgi:predicted aspartyl protease